MTVIDKSAVSLELSRHFDATPEQVFEAWLSSDWGKWLGPDRIRCDFVKLDPRVGGTYLLRMIRPDGSAVEVTGRYIEIARPTKLVFTWMGNYNNVETVITLTFRVDGDGTLMTLRHDGFLTDEQRDGHRTGWGGPNGALEKLAGFLASRKRG